MAIHVHTPYTSPSAPHKYPKADEYMIDDNGFLILSTGRCGQVAVFAPGHFTRAEVVQTRGADGRFAKRS